MTKESGQQKPRNVTSALVVVSAAMLSIGAVLGFLTGYHAGSSKKSPELVENTTLGNSASDQVKALEKQLDRTRHELRSEQAKYLDATKNNVAKKTGDNNNLSPAPWDKRPEGSNLVVEDLKPQVDQNDLVLAFIDEPKKFTGRVLTTRVRYGSRDNYLGMVSKLQERGNAGWNKDSLGNDLVPFFGEAGPNGNAVIDLFIGVPRLLPTPNAAPGDEVLVTFKCGTHPKFGNVAISIVRPRR